MLSVLDAEAVFATSQLSAWKHGCGFGFQNRCVLERNWSTAVLLIIILADSNPL